MRMAVLVPMPMHRVECADWCEKHTVDGCRGERVAVTEEVSVTLTGRVGGWTFLVIDGPQGTVEVPVAAA
jgi:hypothetical protein